MSREKLPSVKELLSLDVDDISKLSANDLSKRLVVLGSAANKRLKRAIETGDTLSPAVRGLQASGGKISAKDKDINELRAEFYRAKKFLDAKTSTHAGFSQYKKETYIRLAGGNPNKKYSRRELKALEQAGKMTAEQENSFWRAYNRMIEVEPNIIQQRGGSDLVQRYLREQITQAPEDVRGEDNLTEYLTDNAMEHFRDIYETEEEKYNEMFGSDLDEFTEV